MNTVAPLPALADNHIRLFHDGRCGAVADPVDPASAIAGLDSRQLALATILVTRRDVDRARRVDAHGLRLQGPIFAARRQGKYKLR